MQPFALSLQTVAGLFSSGTSSETIYVDDKSDKCVRRIYMLLRVPAVQHCFRKLLTMHHQKSVSRPASFLLVAVCFILLSWCEAIRIMSQSLHACLAYHRFMPGAVRATSLGIHRMQYTHNYKMRAGWAMTPLLLLITRR